MINLDYLYSNEKHKNVVFRNFVSKNSMLIEKIDNGYVVPVAPNGDSGGCYTKDGIFVNESSLKMYESTPRVDSQFVKDSKIINKKAIYIGSFSRCWGHFITDSLKKLWFFLDEDWEKNFSDCDLVYITDTGKELEGNYKRLIELLGIPLDRIKIITSNTQYNTLLVPSSCFYCDFDHPEYQYYTKEYLQIIKKIKDSFIHVDIEKDNYKKIYYSYSHFQKKKGYRKTFGEIKLERFFKELGFTIVYPEELNLDLQLTILNECKVFVATEGSVSHNSVFLNEGATIIVIPRGPYLSGYQEVLNSTNNFNVYYVDSSLSALTPKNGNWSGPNYFYVSQELLNFFQIKNKTPNTINGNFKDIIDYFSYCIVDLQGRKYDVQNIYSEKFFYYFSLHSKNLFVYKRAIRLLRRAVMKLVRKTRNILSHIH